MSGLARVLVFGFSGRGCADEVTDSMQCVHVARKIWGGQKFNLPHPEGLKEASTPRGNDEKTEEIEVRRCLC